MASSEHRRMEARLLAMARKHAKARAALDAIEAERAALFVAARQLEPPMTWAAMAAIFGVTEAAVSQHVKRYQRETADT